MVFARMDGNIWQPLGGFVVVLESSRFLWAYWSATGRNVMDVLHREGRNPGGLQPESWRFLEPGTRPVWNPEKWAPHCH